MSFPRWVVPTVLALLMIDAIIELSFISSMVAWLYRTAGGDFEVMASETADMMSFPLHGKPKNLLVNQGHTSNGAAGTAFVLVGIGGILVLALRHHGSKLGRLSGTATTLHQAWLISIILSMLLTLAALIYTFVITNAHMGQTIDLATAISLDNRPYPNYVAYPDLEWTPENWFAAVLELPLRDSRQVKDISRHLTIMRAWRWNLIPLFIFGLSLSVVSIVEAWIERRNRRTARPEKFEPVRGQE